METLKITTWLLAGALSLGWMSNADAGGSGSADLESRVSLQVIDGRPIVDGVMVNGHGPYRFLVDTGSNVDLIEAALAATIKLEPNYRNDLSSAAGTTAVVGSTGNDVAIDSIAADHQLFIFSDLRTIHHLSPDIRGVLGQPFLSRFDYFLDLRSRKLEFGKREWSGVRVPFKMMNARPTVQTNLGWLVMDSGTNSLFVFGITSADVTQSITTLSGSIQTGNVSTRLTIAGNLVWHGQAIAVPRQAKEEGDGLLPANLFKAIYVCNSEAFIGFERN